MSTVEIILGALSLLLLVLSGYLFYESRKVKSTLKSLTKGVSKGNLEDLVRDHLSKTGTNSTAIEELRKELNKFREFSKKDIQKVAFKRYNPFHETGGDQSFTLALLDGNNTGALISSLHQRDLTRVYGKQIVKGECEQKLSEEELAVLEEAMKEE
jgi:histone acetyltransferase (RNA polymerase elongator complex component)